MVPESRDACVLKRPFVSHKFTLTSATVLLPHLHLPLRTRHHQPRLTLKSTSTEASYHHHISSRQEISHSISSNKNVICPTKPGLLRPTTTARLPSSRLSTTTSTFPFLNPYLCLLDLTRRRCNTPRPRPRQPKNLRKTGDVWQLGEFNPFFPVRAVANGIEVWRPCAAVGCAARRANVVWIVLIVAVKEGWDVLHGGVKIGRYGTQRSFESIFLIACLYIFCLG